MNKYFTKIVNTEQISSWKSKGLSNEIIKPPTTSNNSLAPSLDYFIKKIKVNFNGSCLRQDKITYNHGTIVNMYIVYKQSSNLHNFYFALEDCLFDAVKLTKVTLISTSTVAVVLDLIQEDVFYFLIVALLKM